MVWDGEDHICQKLISHSADNLHSVVFELAQGLAGDNEISHDVKSGSPLDETRLARRAIMLASTFLGGLGM